MKLILLSGGSGKRLWPLSNDSRSKQFLKVLKDNSGQHLNSMVQRVWGQLKAIGLSDSAVIATGKGQVEMIHSQLGKDVPLIIEPERRDTFPAIALAATYLYSVQGAGLNDIVGVLPVDPFVDVDFFNRVKELEGTLNTTHADLALLGVKPSFPSSKYGYIVPDSTEEDFIKVSHFKEKPEEGLAKHLIDEGALWNCGVFAFRLGHIIDLLEKNELPVQYESLSQQYNKLPKTSFDYEVVEKTNNIVALPYTGYWKDLGTWNTLTEEMATSQIGKGIISHDSENTHLINELDIPINILGLPDAVVAASPDGILVSSKEASPRVKELLKGQDQRLMYEERRWGWYKVLDYTKYVETNEEVLTKKILIKKGQNISYHSHHIRQEIWTIVKGEALVAKDGEIITAKTGDVITIPVGSEHAIFAKEELEIIEIQSGTEVIDEDIDRTMLDWTEIENFCNSNKVSK